jgi:hypothetical protein
MSDTASITHILEIRIGSMRNDPVCQLESSASFGSFSIGDQFYHEGIYHDAWHDLPAKNEVFYITEKAHIVSAINTNKILHLIIICLNARAFRDI